MIIKKLKIFENKKSIYKPNLNTILKESLKNEDYYSAKDQIIFNEKIY